MSATYPRFLGKKLRLFLFLTRRLPRFGWRQWRRGLRDRSLGYTAMELADVLPADAKVIVDVGAHHGDYAAALDFLFDPDRILAIEANPRLSQPLRARFAGHPRIEVIPTAAGEREGEIDFNVYEFDAASSFYVCEPGHLSAFGCPEGSETIKVPMTTLARILDERGLSRVDLLKLDCQGAELSILRGAGPALSRVRAVYTEVEFDSIYHGAPRFGEVHDFLRAQGFVLSGLSGFSGRDGSVQWADALYLRPVPAASAPRS
jgi:FkbM family methyltransferase